MFVTPVRRSTEDKRYRRTCSGWARRRSRSYDLTFLTKCACGRPAGDLRDHVRPEVGLLMGGRAGGSTGQEDALQPLAPVGGEGVGRIRPMGPHFEALADAGGLSAQVLTDSSVVSSHRSASGKRGGGGTRDRPLSERAHHEDPCPCGSMVPPCPADAHG